MRLLLLNRAASHSSRLLLMDSRTAANGNRNLDQEKQRSLHSSVVLSRSWPGHRNACWTPRRQGNVVIPSEFGPEPAGAGAGPADRRTRKHRTCAGQDLLAAG
jgi:hypothetical protein